MRKKSSMRCLYIIKIASWVILAVIAPLEMEAQEGTVMEAQEESERFYREVRIEPFCSLPNFITEVPRLFEDTNFHQISSMPFIINEDHRRKIRKDLAPIEIPYDSLGRHQMYFPVTQSNVPLGMVLVRKILEYKYGAVTVGWRFDFDYKFVDFYINSRNPYAEKISAKKNELLSAMSNVDPDSLISWIDEKKLKLSKKGSEILGTVVGDDLNINELTAIVIYTAVLSRSSARNVCEDGISLIRKFSRSLRELKRDSKLEHWLQGKSMQTVGHFVEIPRSIIREACRSIKATLAPELKDLTCRPQQIIHLKSGKAGKTYWILDQEVELDGKLQIVRWLLDNESRVISVDRLGEDLASIPEMSDMINSLLRVINKSPIVELSGCNSGSEVKVYQVQQICLRIQNALLVK
jgi:hypothetical protein